MLQHMKKELPLKKIMCTVKLNEVINMRQTFFYILIKTINSPTRQIRIPKLWSSKEELFQSQILSNYMKQNLYTEQHHEIQIKCQRTFLKGNKKHQYPVICQLTICKCKEVGHSGPHTTMFSREFCFEKFWAFQQGLANKNTIV